MSTSTEVRERPVIFSGPMVRAILEGRKTQTRRVVKPQPEPRQAISRLHGFDDLWASTNPGDDNTERAYRCPYGQPGDLLYVREGHARVPVTAYAQSTGVEQIRDPNDPDMAVVYREGWTRCSPGRWRPSIHMPKWASRLWLRVTDVRVERVQEIDHFGAVAEGIPPGGAGETGPYVPTVNAFRNLWDSINADRGYSWESNPWVWVVSFERMQAAQDAAWRVGR